jgi:circadian clock protein KaiC
VSAEHTMVDGIVLLREAAFGVRRERNLEVVKFRGSKTLRGNHAFQIGPQGIVVYPRLESARRPGAIDAVHPVGVSTGVAGLDRMFDIGGYAKGSVTALSGPSGCGKTTLALHFAAQARTGDSALFVGFYESPSLLQRVAATIGVELPQDDQVLEFMWQSFGENMLDELAAGILERVSRRRHARVIIDGAGGLMAAPAFQERGGAFLSALMNELRALGTTTLITVEQMDATRALILDSATMSALADTVLDMHLTRSPSVRRFAAIRKSRVSRCDARERELTLTDTGLAFVEDATGG